ELPEPLANLFTGTSFLDSKSPSVDLSKPLESKFIGKVMKEEKYEARYVGNLIPRELQGLEGRNGFLTVGGQSHSADCMQAICTKKEGESVLVAFSLKHATSRNTPEAKIKEDIAKVGRTFHHLSPDQKALFTHRIMLVISYPNPDGLL